MGRSVSLGPVIFFLLCTCSVVFSAVFPSVINQASTIEGRISVNVSVPAGNKLQRFFYGVGYQMYQYNGSSWVFNNVSSDLFNLKGKKVGHHFYLAHKDFNGGQPSWETFHPYSLVTGKVIESEPQLHAIPLLLLEATNNTGSLRLLGSTSFVQRLFTRHGLPPPAHLPAVTGDMFYSAYSALYGFSAPEQHIWT